MLAEKQCSLKSASGRWILLATILASGAAFLVGTAVPVALPRIQSEFSTALSGIQWVVNAQLLSLSALILIGGALGDQYGRKRIFISGIALSGTAALVSGFAPTIEILIPLQALQGVGSALMVPQSLAIINDCFVESERGRAIGLWAGLSGGVAALGPLLGGWLVDTVSWSGVFFIMVPISIAALVITLLFVPNNPSPQMRKLDWQATVLIFLGLLGLAFGLISGPARGWGIPSVLVSLIGGVVAIGLFVAVENRQSQPLVSLRIFRNSLVAGANVVTLFLYFGLNGGLFFIVLNLQQIQGYSPTETGLGLLPPIVLITVFTAPSGALADRIGPRLQMIIGPLIVAIGMSLLATAGADAAYLRHFLPGLVLFGIGMAIVIPPLTKSALSVKPQFSGSASGINNGVSRVAGLLGIAVLGAVVISTFNARLVDALDLSSLTMEQKQVILEQSEKLGGITIPDTFDELARLEARRAVQTSFAYGYRWAMGVCAGLAFVSVFVSAATIRNPVALRGGENNLPDWQVKP